MGDPTPRQDLGDQPGRFSLGSEKRVTTGLSSLLGLPLEKLCTPGCFLCHGASLRHTTVVPASQAVQCRRLRFNPWVRKIPWRKDGNPLQYSCLENLMDGGVWQATVHGVAELDKTERLSLPYCK